MTVHSLSDDAQMRAFGATLARTAKIGDVWALTGDLGAGKTTLARGFIEALCGAVDVPSPTYTLVQTYAAPEFEIWHCDLYRLERPDDILELGLLDAFEDSVCLIEWPEKLGPYKPRVLHRLHIDFADDGGRLVRVSDTSHSRARS